MHTQTPQAEFAVHHNILGTDTPQLPSQTTANVFKWKQDYGLCYVGEESNMAGGTTHPKVRTLPTSGAEGNIALLTRAT